MPQNRDGEQLQKRQKQEPRLILHKDIQKIHPSWTGEQAQILADGIVYYQTSLAPQFVLPVPGCPGIPTIQVGHKPCVEDPVVDAKACSVVTSGEELLHALTHLQGPSDEAQAAVKKNLGLHDDWPIRLKELVQAAEAAASR